MNDEILTARQTTVADLSACVYNTTMNVIVPYVKVRSLESFVEFKPNLTNDASE